MKLNKALELFLNERPVIVDSRTIEAESVDHIRLESGEDVFWIHGEGGIWVSIDQNSEEVMLFQEIVADLEAYDETLEYRGVDYEFTYEEGGKVKDEDGEEIDRVDFKEYEADGEIIRIAEFEVSGEKITLVGRRLTEDDLQEV